MKFNEDQLLALMLEQRIDGDKTLDRIFDRGINVSTWCKERQIQREYLYKILRGEMGKRRSARECRRIVGCLNEEGLLVEKFSDTEASNG